jgi:hypothetical protein
VCFDLEEAENFNVEEEEIIHDVALQELAMYFGAKFMELHFDQ